MNLPIEPIYKIMGIIEYELKPAIRNFESGLIASHLSQNDIDHLEKMMSDLNEDFNGVIQQAIKRVRK